MNKHPKDNDDVLWIAELTISTLFLYREQRFKGYCFLSFSKWNATSLEALNEEEFQYFCRDLYLAGKAIRSAFAPDHMNYELLGNTNPHLHWHIIPRYKDDPRWGQPVWEEWPRNEFQLNRHTISDREYMLMIDQIRQELTRG